MAYSSCFSLDFLDFPLKKVYNIDYRSKHGRTRLIIKELLLSHSHLQLCLDFPHFPSCQDLDV